MNGEDVHGLHYPLLPASSGVLASTTANTSSGGLARTTTTNTSSGDLASNLSTQS